MTDIEIVRALRCCGNCPKIAQCKEFCAYYKGFNMSACIPRMTEEAAKCIERLTAEVARYRKWVNDLQSGMTVNCVYCGHSYGPAEDTPVSMADVLKQHIEHCPEHPMSKLKAENERLTRERDAAYNAAENACEELNSLSSQMPYDVYSRVFDALNARAENGGDDGGESNDGK